MDNGIKCEVCGEKTGRVDNKNRIFMAKFPLHEKRCKQWVKVIGKADLVFVPIEKLHQLKYVCGKHFKPTDFMKTKTQLKRKAVPSVDLSLKPLSELMLVGFPLHNDHKTLEMKNRSDFSDKAEEVNATEAQKPIYTPKARCSDEDYRYSENSLHKEEDSAKKEIIVNAEGDNSKENYSEFRKETLVHSDFTCNVCYGQIIGFRYTCLQCLDWDMCTSCEAAGEHPEHYVLRLPAPRPCKETDPLIAAFRQQMRNLPEFCGRVMSDVDMKDEELDDEMFEEDADDTNRSEPAPNLQEENPLAIDTNTNHVKLENECKSSPKCEKESEENLQMKSHASLHKNNMATLNVTLHNNDTRTVGQSRVKNRCVLKLVVRPVNRPTANTATTNTAVEGTIFKGKIIKSKQTLHLPKRNASDHNKS